MADSLPGAWGWSEAEFRAAAHRAADLAASHLAGLSDQRVVAPVPVPVAERWRHQGWPAYGMPLDQLLAELEQDVLSHPLGNGHPRFHAWVNSPPDRAGVLADLLASAMNPSCAGGNQALVHLERLVIRWLADLAGLPAGAGGLLVSGGSLATVTALAAARQAGAGYDVREHGLAGQPPLTVYAGDEAHSCVTKAVELLGLGRRHLHLLPGRRLDPAGLDWELDAARHRGERPVAVVATAGSTSTGAIDPLTEIADVCARHQVWLHVDGAYGAPAVLTGRHRSELAGLGLADSVAIDPHKWLYVPVDAGALLVREPDRLRDAFSLVPAYLAMDHDPEGISDAPWLSEYGPEQTRPPRALRVWATLASTGRDGYRRLIDHDLDLAERLADGIRAHPDLELVAAGLSVVCFRYRGADDTQAEIARRLQRGGESFLTTTEVDGQTVLRACFVNPLTTDADVDTLIKLVTELGAAVVAAAA
jgi:glutamate/tyrosine decarboxylase-like PLP-dependent enzyme